MAGHMVLAIMKQRGNSRLVWTSKPLGLPLVTLFFRDGPPPPGSITFQSSSAKQRPTNSQRHFTITSQHTGKTEERKSNSSLSSVNEIKRCIRHTILCKISKFQHPELSCNSTSHRDILAIKYSCMPKTKM